MNKPGQLELVGRGVMTTVSGSVCSRAGACLDSLVVTIQAAASFDSPIRVLVKADGAFAAEVPSSDWVLLASSANGDLGVAHGSGSATGVRLELRPGRSCSGVVLDAVGNPVAARVHGAIEVATERWVVLWGLHSEVPNRASGGSFQSTLRPQEFIPASSSSLP